MNTRKSDVKTYIAASAVFGVLSVGMALAAVPLGNSVKQAALFAVYQIFLLFLPGALLTATFVIFKDSEVDFLSFLFVSFAVGYGLNILEYFLLALIGITVVNSRIVAGCIVLIAVALSTIRFLRSRHTASDIHRNRKNLNAQDQACGLENHSLFTAAGYCVLFLGLLFVIYFSYSANYTLPDSVRTSVTYHRDSLYWVENAAALKISFPPEEIRYSGMPLYYHYFASIYVAFASLVTGIDCFSLSYALYPLCRAMLLFGGLYVLAKTVLKKDLLRLFFLAALLFTTGIERNTWMKYVAQLIFLPFGFDISLGFGAYSIATLIKQVENDSSDPLLIAGGALAMFMCAGHKSPVALVYMVFAGVICLGWLVTRRPGRAFANGIPLVAVFSIVMVVCIGLFAPGESRVNAGTFSLNATLKISPLYVWHEGSRLQAASGLSAVLTSVGSWAAAFTCMVLCVNPLIIFLDITGVIALIVRRKNEKPDVIDCALLLSALFGLCMGLFNDQNGISQMYYALAAFIPGLLFGLRHLRFEKKFLRYPLGVAVAVLFVLQCRYYFVDAGTNGLIKDGVDRVFSSTDISAFDTSDSGYDEFSEMEEIPENYPPDSMQLSDYEALCWIRDNTPVDSILVSDRDIRLEQHTYMYHGTFSERRMWLEGDCYLYGAYWQERDERRNDIRLIYLNYPEALEKAKADGVDYVIQTKWIKPDFEGNGCTPVFENETVTVWKID